MDGLTDGRTGQLLERLVGVWTLVSRAFSPVMAGWFVDGDRLVGLMVKASALRTKDPESDSRLWCWEFYRVESYQ